MDRTDKNSVRRRALCDILLFMVLTVATLAAVRCFFIAKFASLDAFISNISSVPLFLLNALRFDAQVGAYGALPLLLFAIAVCIWPSRLASARDSFASVYTPVAQTIIGLVALADVHWYNNFSRHFDMVIFDFFDEDPSVLIKGVWNEAPVLLMLVGMAAIFFAARYAYRRLSAWAASALRPPFAAMCVVVLLLVAVALRGSLGVFTLRPEDTYVSSSRIVNDCVPNGLYMLKKAWSEKKKQFRMESDESILASEGFSSLDDALAAFDSAQVSKPLDEALFARTADSVACPRMNVVLLICESWGQKLMKYDETYGIDLLCSMRQHLAEDLVWRNFVSATNGTIDAVEALTSASAYERLYTSRYRNVPLPSDAARPWHDNGYRTQFISGIEISWRNLIDVLPNHAFDRVVGKFEILDERQDAEQNHTWGIYDHAMLDYLLAQLCDSSNHQPNFIVALTSTNHTPFEFPEGYDLPDITLPDDPDAFAISDMEVVWDYLRGYQYTSQALGQFMSDLKASPAGANTIVAITGDHNTRLVLPYPEGEDPMWRYSVPLYLYVPNASDDMRELTERFGSHYDIIPTLAGLSLPSCNYFRAGKDLLDPSTAGGDYGVNVAYTMIDPEADRPTAERRVSAWRALSKIWFKRQFE